VVYHLIILDPLSKGRGIISQRTLDEHLQVFILLRFIVAAAKLAVACYRLAAVASFIVNMIDQKQSKCQDEGPVEHEVADGKGRQAELYFGV